MPYVRPGVEVRQVQQSLSPTLTTPSLIPVVIGPAYNIQEITNNQNSLYTSVYSQTFSVLGAPPAAFTVSGASGALSNVDDNSVYVDIITQTLSNAGQVIHLSKLDSNGTLSLTSSAGSITLLGTSTNYSGAQIRVGYRQVRDDLAGFREIGSSRDIETTFGKVDLMNTLAYGTLFGLNASTPNTIFAYAVSGFGATGSTETTAHTNALTDLSIKETYAMAPLTSLAGTINLYKTHVDNYSVSTEKKERIVINTPKIAWTTLAGGSAGAYATGAAAADKSQTANQVRNNALSIADKRVYYLFPDVAYVLRRSSHVSTLSPNYINSIYFSPTTGSSGNLNAILAGEYTVGTTVYRAGTEITSAIFTVLQSQTNRDYTYFDAYIPVPSYFFAPYIAGLIASQPPQQGFTNMSLGGPDGVKYASDWFTESHLNTIADGGNMILVQDIQNTTPVTIRHQLSTNRLSVETQELSITKAIDYCTKFIRNGLKPYIGKFNINARTLGFIKMHLLAQCKYLVDAGVVEDIVLSTLKQHETQKDTVVVDMNIKVLYPVNYIQVTLIF